MILFDKCFKPATKVCFFIKPWLIAAACLFLLPVLSSAQIPIEKIQRAYQTRYHTLTGDYLIWPTPKIGNTCAPHYPKDGFYKNLQDDPEFCSELIDDLVAKFYYNNIIYSEFVKAPNGEADLQNATAIENYTSAEMPAPLGTYLEKWAVISSAMMKLTLQSIPGNQVFTVEDSKVTSAYNNSMWTGYGSGDCESAVDCVLANHSGTLWGEYSDYRSGCILNGDWELDTPSPVIGVYFERFGEERENSWTDPESGFTYGPGGIAYVVWATAWNTRGKIGADLTQFKKGVAKIYLKIDKFDLLPADGYIFAQTNPTGATVEGVYRHWPEGLLTLGADSTTDAYVTHSDSAPTATGYCNTTGAVIGYEYGWMATDAVVVVRPEFPEIIDPQDACSCTKCAGGSMDAALGSINLNIGLGGENFGSYAGSLALNAEIPSILTATPSALRYSLADNIEAITNSYGPIVHLQFRTSQCLADVSTNNSFNYTISFYSASDAGTKDGSGYYQPTSAPYSTIVIENPDASTNVYNRLRITRTMDAVSKVTEFTYISTNGLWEMVTGGGARKEARISSWSGDLSTKNETTTVTNASNQLVSMEVDTYQQFSWGLERIRKIIDPNGAALTNTWSFYTNAGTDGGGFGRLKEEVDPNGHWVRHKYDEFGRETNSIVQFLNSDSTSPDSSNRVILTIYSTNAPHVTTIETLMAAELRREYRVINTGEVQVYRCQTPGAAWDATNNLRTVTTTFTNGSFAGEVKSILNPIGMIQLSFYETNSTIKTTTVLSGVLDTGTGTNIIQGTRTITIVTLGGQTLTNLVYSVAPGRSEILIRRDVYTYLDALNRSHQIVHLDGTTNSNFYACCGLESSIDTDGAESFYLYDTLERQSAIINHGITVTNSLDAVGRTLVTTRIGTNGSSIFVSQSSYDVASRKICETNALGAITRFSEGRNGTGQLVKTNMFHDGGVRMETFNMDGTLAEVEGSAAIPIRYIYGVEDDGTGVSKHFTCEIKLTSTGGTNEWTKTYSDMIGRVDKVLYAAPSGDPNPTEISVFNNFGQLVKQTDADARTTLFQYNAMGEIEFTAIDANSGNTDVGANGNFPIDFEEDQVTQVVSDIWENPFYGPVQRNRRYVWETAFTDLSRLVSASETTINGLTNWNTLVLAGSATVVTNGGTPYLTNGLVSRSEISRAGTARSEKSIALDGTSSKQDFIKGRLTVTSSHDSNGSELWRSSSFYDSHGRLASTTDQRSGTTIFGYNDADQISSVTTPAPGTGDPTQTTFSLYSAMGLVTNVVNAEGSRLINEYTMRGEVLRQYGANTYPTGFGYDAQGRLSKMTNWSSFSLSSPSGARVTSWNYETNRGWLLNKRYDDGVGPDYAYTLGGKISSRKWARTTNSMSVTTAYTYTNVFGLLSGVSYNDGTPATDYSHNRAGRLETVSRNGMTTTMHYNGIGQPLGESYFGGALSGHAVTNTYNVLQQRASVVALGKITNLFIYNEAARMTNVSDGHNSADYHYLANSTLIDQVVYREGSNVRMTTAKDHDLLNRLQVVRSTLVAPAGGSMEFRYRYNQANQRTRAIREDGSYWNYKYDVIGQLIAGRKQFDDDAPVPGQQYEYSFDWIGNRLGTGVGGDAQGAALRTSLYTNNSLNQITARTNPDKIDIIGTATTDAAVSINGNTNVFRRNIYFHNELLVTNLSYPSITVLASNSSVTNTVAGSRFILPAIETFGYDLDGNCTNDGRFILSWDAENRLIQMESHPECPTNSHRKLIFEYDYLGRRVRKISYENGSSTPSQNLKFLYDGWNLLAELNATNDAVICSYVWGLDLSGSSTGAGGVGGLVGFKQSNGIAHFPAYDGNGNVIALINADSGIASAQYEYGPFGEISRASGEIALENPFRFSTKYQDDESGLLYYGYRYYSPAAGRWHSRDPIEETGGTLLYSFVNNCPAQTIDVDGRIPLDELFDLGFLAYDIVVGAGAATIAVDVASLLVPYVPNPKLLKFGLAPKRPSVEPVRRVLKHMNKTVEMDVQIVKKAGLNEVLAIDRNPLGPNFGMKVQLEFKGSRDIGSGNQPKHFLFINGEECAALEYTLKHKDRSQFRVGLNDKNIIHYYNEAIQAYLKKFPQPTFNTLNGYVHDFAFSGNKSPSTDLSRVLETVGYSNGDKTSRLKIIVGKNGEIHGYPVP